jgi:hypothetical protein
VCRIARPADAVVLAPERAGLAVREVVQHVRVEVPPAQLGHELLRRRCQRAVARRGAGLAQHRRRHRARRERARAQVRGKTRDGIIGEEVAPGGVARQAVPDEVCESSARGGCAARPLLRRPAGHGRLEQCRGKVVRREAFHGGQRGAGWQHLAGPAERRVNHERRARLREHRSGRDQEPVVEPPHRHARRAQTTRTLHPARPGALRHRARLPRR